MREKLRDLADDAGAQMHAAEAYAESVAQDRFDGDTRLGHAAQVGTVLTVVTLGIVIILGILVYGQVDSALPNASGNLGDAQTNSTQTFADAMELAPVIMIILLAAVVLSVVQRFR